MRLINKGAEPFELTEWKRKNQSNLYIDLSHKERQSIRKSLAIEQNYLCAYCASRISGEAEDTTNEHLKPRDKHPNLQLDYQNIVGSCRRTKQCDDAHKSQELPLTPLDAGCEDEFKYYADGTIEGVTDRAKDLIEKLNLGSEPLKNKGLCRNRKDHIDSFLFTETNGEIELLQDKEIRQIMVILAETPNNNGELPPYAPAISAVIRDLFPIN